MAISKEKDKQGIIRDSETVRKLGNEAYYLGKMDEALDYYKKALEIDEGLKDFKGMATDLNSIGSVYWIWGRFEKVPEYHEKALRIAQKIGDRINEGIAVGSLGNVYSDLGDVRKAIEYSVFPNYF